MPAIHPGIVVEREVGAALRDGMIVEPYLDEPVRIGIVEPGRARIVEGSHCGLLRIGHNTVDGLLPVDVCLMLEVPADSGFALVRKGFVLKPTAKPVAPAQ